MMSEDTLRSKTRRLLQKAHHDLTVLWEALPSDERTQMGQPDRWAAKDLLAHLVGWNKRTNRRMAGLPADESPNAPKELHEINAALFEANRERSWEDLLEEDRLVFDEMVHRFEAISEEDLMQPGRLTWAGSRPAWMAILLNAHWHPYHHLSMYLIQRGQLERATEIQEESTRGLIAMDAGDRHKGTSLYNLACFYALTGRPREALSNLKHALPLAPDLIEWSKEDSDLDSLRDLEGYQSLFA